MNDHVQPSRDHQLGTSMVLKLPTGPDGEACRKTTRAVSGSRTRLQDVWFDRFRVWLLAWTALESLVTTRFKRYERIFIERLRVGHRDAPTVHYLARAADVMAERYRLLDRFAIMAGCLFPETAAADMEDFARLKKQRDDVTHGAEVDDLDLGAEAVRQLLRRYLDADLRFGR